MIWKYLILLWAIGAIVVVLLENRHPVKTLAWLMVLTFLPAVGLVLFFFFGMQTRGKRRIIVSDEDRETLARLANEASAEQTLDFRPQTSDFRPQTSALSPLTSDLRHQTSDTSYAKLRDMMLSAARSPLLPGNDVEVFTAFDDMFASLKRDIAAATDSVHVQFFKFENDAIGRELSQLLIRKAAEGVSVRVLYDSAANFFVGAGFYRRMRQGGVQVVSFMRLHLPFIRPYANCRNHRKVVVIDGRTGYLGGMNIAERYSRGVHGGIWRDTHIRITGPAVSQMQASFLTDWRFAAGKLVTDATLFPPLSPTGTIPLQIIPAGPMDEWHVVMQGLLQVISQSRRYVYIQTPYFMPSEPMITVLCNAALGGVDVRLMLPSRGDKGAITQLASCSFLRDLLAAGVRVCFYEAGFLHAKTLVSDDHFCTIGSTNFDFRGFEQDFEINAFIYDDAFACSQRDVFLADERHARYVTYDEWRRRPLIRRFAESVTRLFSPLM